MSARRRDRGRGGFTLIEVLAALTIFGIVAAGLVANNVAAMHFNRSSRSLSAAGELAQDEMEQLRALDPAASPADLTAGDHSDPANPLTEFGAAGGRYTRAWSVTRNAPAPGLSTVAITVSWNEGGARTVRLVGYVCQSRTCT